MESKSRFEEQLKLRPRAGEKDRLKWIGWRDSVEKSRYCEQSKTRKGRCARVPMCEEIRCEANPARIAGEAEDQARVRSGSSLCDEKPNAEVHCVKPVWKGALTTIATFCHLLGTRNRELRTAVVRTGLPVSGSAGSPASGGTAVFSRVFHVPFLDVLARPIYGRTGTRRVLAWAKPILCTEQSSVMVHSSGKSAAKLIQQESLEKLNGQAHAMKRIATLRREA